MVAAGAEHTAAVTEDGELYGWGWGRYGNLGLGDRDDRLVPAKVSTVEVCKHSYANILYFLNTPICKKRSRCNKLYLMLKKFYSKPE